MKNSTGLCMSFLALVLASSNPGSARAQEAILESYSIGHGGNQTAPQGLTATLADSSFGNGTARARILFDEGDVSSKLSLLVRRRVRPDEIVPALLVFRIEIRGLDGLGIPVYSRDLDGFAFGDSRSGLWFKKLDDLPPGVGQISVTFFGNYE